MNPPPPPPHGENPKNMPPPGNYDIFIIPEHSKGGGFIYLPSLKPNANSFAAGFACALVLVAISSALAPIVQAWWQSVKGAGGAGMIMLILAVGVGAWALGRIQTDGGPAPGGGAGNGPSPSSGPHNTHSSSHSNGYAGPHPGTGPMPGAGPMPGGGGGGMPGAGPMPGGPKPSSWQRPESGATGASSSGGGGPNTNTNGSAGASGAARSAWERAREETKRKQEENKAREAEKKRRDELEKKLRELREKELREREAREAKNRDEDARLAKQKADDEAREAKKRADEARKKADEAKKKADEAQEKEKKRLEQETLERKRKDLEILEKRLKEAKERTARERANRESQKADDESSKPKGSTYAFSAVGEKTNPWPRGRPITPDLPRSNPTSPTKRPPPPPTANTFRSTEDDAYSYRPYDKPKKPMQHKKSLSSLYSESSYAASHSTSRTTPPPSQRGPYSTKDPDKIVIKAVYSFNNAFLRAPTSQLVSGVGPVTDGLILRITTEGLFIDDDVRCVPQREWDVKAWTMKLVEVWCPSFGQDPAGISASARTASNTSQKQSTFRRLWGLDKEKPASSEETDALLVEMLQLCKTNCRMRASSSASSAYSASSYDSRSSVSDSAYGSSVGSSSPSRDNLRTDNRGHQTGEMKTARLHVLRASIRDTEGKKYVFVVPEEESWKVAVGLQRLRKGTQVRALGVSGMSGGDARSTLENLGWA